MKSPTALKNADFTSKTPERRPAGILTLRAEDNYIKDPQKKVLLSASAALLPAYESRAGHNGRGKWMRQSNPRPGNYLSAKTTKWDRSSVPLYGVNG